MKKKYIFFGILGLLLSCVISVFSTYEVAILLIACTIYGLSLPAIILHDKDEIIQSEKYIQDPIKTVKNIIIGLFVISIYLAFVCTITSIIITILNIKL